MRTTSWERATALGLAMILVGACAGSGQGTTGSISATTAATTTSASAGTTSTPTAGTTSTPTNEDLPGEPIDFGPAAGDQLAVVGVAHDDVLNVRSSPGIDSDIVAELDPVATGLVATGRNRALPESIWYEVTVDEEIGWVSSAFVSYIGMTDDATAAVIGALGETPGAENMIDLGLIVAETMASTEPESRITITVAPEVGDLGEVTYDVIGLGDDSLGGYRLHVFGDPAEGGEGFVLSNVERTFICVRGVTESGLCL
jgi:hypothetical protein